MKFVCTRDNLAKGLGYVAPLAGRNAQLPVLSHVLCRVKGGALELICTDLEVGARAQVPGKIEGEGSVTVMGKTLLEYIQQLPSSHPLTLEVDKTGMKVTTEGFAARFPVGDVEDFPLLPPLTAERAVPLTGALLGDSLGQVIFSAARDLTRPEIHSVFVAGQDKNFWVAATDSFRLSEVIVDLPEAVEPFSFLLPLSAAQEVVRLFRDQAQITIYPAESHVTFQGEGLEFTSRLVEGKYPDYRQIIPQNQAVSGMLEKQAFLRALKTLAVFLPRDSRRLKCVFSASNGELRLSVQGDRGEGVVTIGFEGQGPDTEVLFNIHYLLEGVQHLPGEACRITCGGSSEPTVLSPPDKARSLYVVMPIQA